jgi:hypothetical protein
MRQVSDELVNAGAAIDLAWEIRMTMSPFEDHNGGIPDDCRQGRSF